VDTAHESFVKHQLNNHSLKQMVKVQPLKALTV